ncbi:MAG TPA: hypothetical protein VK904_02255 [Miltoncostaeaceae bacterium]|nr:hypothetical protein [Miltoncostaeaceae bacterium]
MAHDAPHLAFPRHLGRPCGRGAAAPPRTIDWLRVGVWAGVLVVSCAVWGGIALAIASLVT